MSVPLVLFYPLLFNSFSSHFSSGEKDPSYKDIVYQFRHLSQDELAMFQDKYTYVAMTVLSYESAYKARILFSYGYFCTTICVDVNTYMKYQTER
jgi:hypothetical protein